MTAIHNHENDLNTLVGILSVFPKRCGRGKALLAGLSLSSQLSTGPITTTTITY